jgi:hypothetical protein
MYTPFGDLKTDFDMNKKLVAVELGGETHLALAGDGKKVSNAWREISPPARRFHPTIPETSQDLQTMAAPRRNKSRRSARSPSRRAGDGKLESSPRQPANSETEK